MLQIILMLLGFGSPTSNANTQSTNLNQTEVAQMTSNLQNNLGDDTGGETPVPPKR